MKDAKNANYWQIDHKIKNIHLAKGAVVLPSPEAWEKYKWTRNYFSGKPKEGYFVWVKKQVDAPLFACVSIASGNVSQKLQNLLIIEKNLKIRLQGACGALKRNLCGVHKAQGKIVLREGSSLKYSHIHSWGGKDIVETNYEFFLEKNSKLDYSYENFLAPKKLKTNNLFNLSAGASCNVKVGINCVKTKTEIKDVMVLKEKGSSGIINLRLVGKKESKISARSRIVANSKSKGHLDCQGLLTDKKSEILLTPELDCRNKLAQITHEASIGQIAREQLTYLRMRGLSEKEATDLIINGFLSS